jgi:hypothetical protein
MKQALCSISSKVEVMPGVHLTWIEAPDIAAMAQPGQRSNLKFRFCSRLQARAPSGCHSKRQARR